MEVNILTLKNGINLMAKVTHYTDHIICEKPVMVQSLPPDHSVSGGQARLMMAPFLEFVCEFETGIHINRSDILTINTPLEQLAANYARLHSPIIQSSGLIKP